MRKDFEVTLSLNIDMEVAEDWDGEQVHTYAGECLDDVSYSIAQWLEGYNDAVLALNKEEDPTAKLLSVYSIIEL